MPGSGPMGPMPGSGPMGPMAPMGGMPQQQGPNHGFGPSIFPRPELRHAPHSQKPENQEMDEGDKETRGRAEQGIPSGSNKFMLYGALEEESSREMQDQVDKLKRRQRVNIVPLLNAMFLPWVLLLVIFSVNSFALHYRFPFTVFMFNVGVLISCLLFAYSSFTADRPEREAFYPTYLGVAFVFAVVVGWLLGDLNFWFHMQPCYNIEHLATYTNVDPSTTTMKSGNVVPTRGKRYQDAGKVYFNHDSFIDVSRSMSFKMGELYCVAPIVNKNCKKNCGYDFWAVGINCCAEDYTDFRCGEYNNPSAKNGLRLMHDELRPNFRLAVLEAEGVHKIISTHPIFFYWLQDPVKEMAHMKHQGYKGFVLLMIVTFFGSMLSAFCAFNWARNKFSSANPYA